MNAGAPIAGTAGLLQLIWLASPALPVGGFSYSEGLEAAVDHAGVSDESSASHWLSQQLHLTQARGDLPLLAQALRAWRDRDIDRVRSLNHWVLATRESRELRLQTEQMGRSLVEWLRQRSRDDAPQRARVEALAAMDPTWPAAFALAASESPAHEADVLQAFAFGWAENMVQAALKAVPLGQSAGQRILARLADEIPDAVQRALTTAEDQRQTFSPRLAILSAQHEQQYSRLFRS